MGDWKKGADMSLLKNKPGEEEEAIEQGKI
jgi:hypothetical protein